MLPEPATLFRILLGAALVGAGVLVVRDPGTARRLVVGGRPSRADLDPERDDRTAGDEDGRARAAGALVFLLGVMLLLGEDLPL